MWAKVLKDNVKAGVPFKTRLRRALRTVSPYTSNPDNDRLAFADGLEIVAGLRACGVRSPRVLEVGTGWTPTIPKMLKAFGAARIVKTDVERLCDNETERYAEAFVRAQLAEFAAATGFSASDLLDGLARAGVEDYRCPPATEDLPAASFDLIYSRAVLEHIPPAVLQDLIQEWRRLLAPGGYLMHVVDNSDHFEHHEKSLSRVNFLRYSPAVWAVACFNPQNYQNRLRHSDYKRLLSEGGFEIVDEAGVPDERCLVELGTLGVHARFAAYDRCDLAILRSTFLARKSASA